MYDQLALSPVFMLCAPAKVVRGLAVTLAGHRQAHQRRGNSARG